MTTEQILAILKRSKLKLVGGKSESMSDNDGVKMAQVPILTQVSSDSKYYGTFDTQDNRGKKENSKALQAVPNDNSRRRRTSALDAVMSTLPPGPTPATHKAMSDARVTPVSNIKPIDDDEDFPDKYKLELYRLHAKVSHLESDIKDKDGRLLKALAALDDELMFWKTGLHSGVWETYDTMTKRMNRIVGAIEYLKDVQPHVSPPLPIPARWKAK